jgi:Insecticide toxin TcdB middle/N-terminal region/FG-GAP-like repeat/Salmonella virulence plasmid 65kDa B protein
MLRMRAWPAAIAKALPSSALLRGFGKGVMVAGFLIASLLNAMAQMSLPGKFATTSTGGASYQIPIVVPPGTAGMVPSLSLEYSSQTGGSASGWLGAGLVGVGWTLAGIPAVGRCPQTVAQDGVLVAVAYNANDRFCLEGQRLIAITSGTYGADGMEYRTEVDSFTRIISHGAVAAPGSGPLSFEVHTKSGQTLLFGSSGNSRVVAQGINGQGTTVKSWGVDKVSDTKGNYFTVTYFNDTQNGYAYPTRIDYTGNSGAGVAPYNSVRFVYSTSRPDVVPIYHAGSLIQTMVRLTNVQTYAGSTFVADYRIAYNAYNPGPTATGRSQVASVTLCDGSGNCLLPTNFTWQNGTTTPTVINNVAGANTQLKNSRPYLADFNGTGRTAILWDDGGDATLPWSSGAATRVLWSFTGTGSTVVPSSNFAGQDSSFPGYVPIVGDFNRDGRADIWWYALTPVGFGVAYNANAAGPTSVSLSNSNGTYTTIAGPTLPVDQFDFYRFLAAGDLNGDGRSDLIWIHQVTSTETAPVREWLINPDGSVSTSLNDAGQVAAFNNLLKDSWLSALGAADFNGDGFTDLLWTINSNLGYGGSSAGGLWLSNGNGNFTIEQINDGNGNFISSSVTGYTPYFGDFNGDGKTDILWVKVDSAGRSSGQQPVLWTSRGDSNGTFVVNSTLGGLTGGSIVNCIPTVADFNGDGIADILWVPSDANGLSSGQPVLWLSKGDGTFTTSNFGSSPLISYVALIGDFNGDGKADVLWDSRILNDSRSQGTRVIWLSDGVAPDLMTGVTNGVGANVTVTYNSITNNTKDNNGNIIVVYTKGTTATDPTVDVQAPMQVVSRVDKSNGVGGLYSTTYTYAGAQLDNSGRGFLGFQQLSTTDLQTGIVDTTTYRQDFPFTSQVATDQKTFNSTILSQATNSYASTAFTAPDNTHHYYQVMVSQTIASGNDLDGSVLPQTTTTFNYDNYNNATLIKVCVLNDSSKITNNTYTNDTTNWYLGRLVTSSVTSAAPASNCP